MMAKFPSPFPGSRWLGRVLFLSVVSPGAGSTGRRIAPLFLSRWSWYFSLLLSSLRKHFS